MTDYTKSTNFATKDNLSSGNPLKIVKGTEIDTEFNNIATAVATKADLASPTFTGTPTLPTGTVAVTQSSGSNTTTIATTAFVQAAIALLHPVGSIYINATNSSNPSTLFGFGTWIAYSQGRVLVGLDVGGNPLFDTAEETGGSADATLPTHTHTTTVTDHGHNHTYLRPSTTLPQSGSSTNCFVPSNITDTTSTAFTGITVANSTEGSSGTNANYQPYITVYMWKRTA